MVSYKKVFHVICQSPFQSGSSSTPPRKKIINLWKKWKSLIFKTVNCIKFFFGTFFKSATVLPMNYADPLKVLFRMLWKLCNIHISPELKVLSRECIKQKWVWALWNVMTHIRLFFLYIPLLHPYYSKSTFCTPDIGGRQSKGIFCEKGATSL